MALNTSKCNHLTPLPFKGLTAAVLCATDRLNETELEEERWKRPAAAGRRVVRSVVRVSVKFTDAGPNQVDGRRRIIISKRDV